MAEMTAEQRDAFLNEPRIATLATLTREGAPVAIPIWFEWDGERARMFTGRTSPKVTRIQRDGRVCLTVAEPAGVPEAWVAIEGTASIEEGTGFALAQRLAPRYYPPEQAARTLAEWGRSADNWVTIVVEPRRIRSSAPE
jgi:PPOX class probable F420-dependent enzyme